MTTQELIELSLLDAMGLLEDHEQQAFEVALSATSPALQAQVRREQSRFSQMEALLPRVEPPADLRVKVLARLREAMAQEAATTTTALSIPMMRSRTVSPMWRAAALALGVSTLLMAGTTLYFRATNFEIARNEKTDALVRQVADQFGMAFVQDVLFDRDTRRLVFSNATGDFKGEASLFVNPEWPEAQFFCRAINVPSDRVLRLAIVDENDQIVKELSTFQSDGELMRRQFARPNPGEGKLAILTSTANPGEYEVLGRAELKDLTS